MVTAAQASSSPSTSGSTSTSSVGASLRERPSGAPPTPSILSAAISSKAIDSGLRARGGDLRRHDGAQAVTELAVVAVDLPGTLGGQGDQRELRLAALEELLDRGSIIVSRRSAMGAG